MLSRPIPKTIVDLKVNPFFQMIDELYKTMNIHLENYPDDIHKIQLLRDHMIEMEMSLSMIDEDIDDAMERFNIPKRKLT